MLGRRRGRRPSTCPSTCENFPGDPGHYSLKEGKSMGFVKANFVPLVIGVVIGRFVWPVVANRLGK